ncbi:ribonuclease H-like domain-containing protein [Tanacetum coccineum]
MNRPTERLNLHVSTISPLSNSYTDAFNDPNCQNAMNDEYNAFIKNNTWTLVPRLANANVVRSMWLFRHKHLTYETLSRYKARLVANGSTELSGIDVDETFSLVVKPATRWTVLSLATSRHWPGTNTAYLVLYVDDIVLTASSDILLQQIIASLHPDRTPVDTESKLGDDGDPVSDPTLYRSLAGALRYLTFTRLDISYVVQQVCLYMHDPRKPHFLALKRILRYVRGTLDHGLQLFSSSTTTLVAYSDADWDDCPTTRRSTLEYRGVVNAVIETCWLRNLLRKLHTPLSSATLVYCDNVSAFVSLIRFNINIEIDIHFVRDLVVVGQVRVLHVPSRYQYADIFTKGLHSALFEEFRSSLSIRCPPAQTAVEC